MAVTVDGTLVRTWESSGTTDEFEVVDLTGNDGALEGNLASVGVSGQVVQITGQLGENEWVSIVEVSAKLDGFERGQHAGILRLYAG